MSLRPAVPAEAETAGTPYPEVTGLFCRVPSPRSTPDTPEASHLGHQCRFSVRSAGIPFPSLLFIDSKDRGNRPKGGGYSRLEPVLAITALPGPRPVKQGDDPASPTLKCQRLGLRCRMVSCRHRNINRFPFRSVAVKLDLRTGLPPANDVLPGNPGPFGGGDSHPSWLLLPPGSALLTGPLNFTAQLLPSQDALLPGCNLSCTLRYRQPA